MGIVMKILKFVLVICFILERYLPTLLFTLFARFCFFLLLLLVSFGLAYLRSKKKEDG
jgi:hypothetical protein